MAISSELNISTAQCHPTRLRLLVAAVVLFCPFGTLHSQELYFQGQVIIELASDALVTEPTLGLRSFGVADVDSVLKLHGVIAIESLVPKGRDYRSSAGRKLARTFRVWYTDGADPLGLAEKLSLLPSIKKASPNRRQELMYLGTPSFTPSDTMFAIQWNLDFVDDRVDIDAPEAWAIERGDPSVVLAITDLGTLIDTTQGEPWWLYPDLNYYFNPAEDVAPLGEIGYADIDTTDNSVSTDPDSLPDNVVGANFGSELIAWSPGHEAVWDALPFNTHQLNATICNMHGVNVASISCAEVSEDGTIVGVANRCGVYMVRNGHEDPILQGKAVLHAAIHGDIVNMSWAYTDEPDSTFAAYITAAAMDEDAVLVAGCGNYSSGERETVWPARYPEVLSVGNMDSTLSLHAISEYGPEVGDVSVVAPVGDGIPANSHSSGCTQSQTILWQFGGTSAASPQAAGVAALLRSRFPGLDQQEVRERIMRSAEWYWSASQSDSIKYGAGKVNAYRALTEWGTISEDTTWDAGIPRDGAYYVSGDLVVEEGVTLTINRGTVVRVAPDHEKAGEDTTRVEIVIKGSLEIGGSSGVVTFESFTDTTATDSDWAGIRFASASTANTLAHLEIKHAQAAIESEVPLLVSNATIDSCETGIAMEDSLTLISSSIDVTSMAVLTAGAVACSTTQISGKGEGYGIYAADSDEEITLYQSVVDGFECGVYIGAGGSAEIDECTFTDNDTGVEVYVSSDVTIESCRFDGNTTNGIYLNFGDALIEGDTLTDNANGIMLYKTGSGTTIRETNVIEGNTTGIKCDSNAHPILRNNKIMSNQIGLATLDGSDPDVGYGCGADCGGEDANQGNNDFSGNTSYHVVNLSSSVTVSAECNYWGSGGPKPGKFSGGVDHDPYLSSAPSLVIAREPAAAPEPARRLPQAYDLAQGVPNPFNPTTTIRYQVPQPGGLVQIRIYDVRGRLVRSLVGERREAGFYATQWDGVDERGQTVASGVYFLQMKAPGFTKMRKLVVLK
jgi:hypothetical protein